MFILTLRIYPRIEDVFLMMIFFSFFPFLPLFHNFIVLYYSITLLSCKCLMYVTCKRFLGVKCVQEREVDSFSFFCCADQMRGRRKYISFLSRYLYSLISDGRSCLVNVKTIPSISTFLLYTLVLHHIID